MKNILNFGIGIIFGVIAVFMWRYSPFLYYTVLIPQAVVIFILINYPSKANKKR